MGSPRRPTAHGTISASNLRSEFFLDVVGENVTTSASTSQATAIVVVAGPGHGRAQRAA